MSNLTEKYLRIEPSKEYNKKGKLFYECTFAFIREEDISFNNNTTTGFPATAVITGENGPFIRINHATRYNPDGSVQWSIEYNENGTAKK